MWYELLRILVAMCSMIVLSIKHEDFQMVLKCAASHALPPYFHRQCSKPRNTSLKPQTNIYLGSYTCKVQQSLQKNQDFF